MQSSKWVTLIFGALCLMAVAGVLGAQNLYYMAAILLTLPGVSYLFGWHALRGLQFERKSPPILWAGETADIVCRVQNPTRVPRYFLSLQDHLPEGAERDGDPPLFNLGPGESANISQKIRFTRRGVFHSDSLEANAIDPLGVFSFTRQIPGQEEFVVYPDPLTLPDFTVSGTERYGWQSVLRAAHRGGSVDPDGVRRYVTGDPLRRIHWRQTARTGQLSVIEFEESYALNLLIALDCDRETMGGAASDNPLEYGIRAAVSLAQAALAQGGFVGLLTAGDSENDSQGEADALSVPSGRGDGHLFPLLDSLARIPLRDHAPLEALLHPRIGAIPTGTTLLAITASADLRFAETLAAFRSQGVATFVLYIDPRSFDRGRNERFRSNRDDFAAALLANGTQVALLQRDADGEARLEILEDVAA